MKKGKNEKREEEVGKKRILGRVKNRGEDDMREGKE
jgi:hypothetical protein